MSIYDQDILIYIDNRESELFSLINNEKKENISIHFKTLLIGDVVIIYKDITYCIMERKTMSDLLSSINDGRYHEQKYRLIHSSDISSHNIIYLLEGIIPEDKTNIIMSCVASISLFSQCSIFRTLNINESLDYIIGMALKIKKNIDNGKIIQTTLVQYSHLVHQKKQNNITYENIQHIMLNQIPKVSNVTSDAIYKKYNSISTLIDAIKVDKTCLSTLTYECNGKKRKLNKNAVSNIINYLS